MGECRFLKNIMSAFEVPETVVFVRTQVGRGTPVLPHIVFLLYSILGLQARLCKVPEQNDLLCFSYSTRHSPSHGLLRGGV